MNTVPAHKSIRRNRVRNVDTDRLRARRLYVATLMRDHSRAIESRHEYVMRAAELVAIERELVDRGALAPAMRVTREG